MRPGAAVIALSILLGVSAAAGMHSAQAQGKARCESQAPGGDTRDITCPLKASGAAQRFRFKANFSGGHDDTMASMTATLDGAPLACEQGSKTSLMGEDGDVSLECRFSIGERPPGERFLRVTVSWRHAQYTDFELGSD
jgi:hypothetical protein